MKKLVSLVLVVGAVFILGSCGKTLTTSDIDSIEIGDSVKIVEDILGKPTNILEKDAAKDSLIYLASTAEDNYEKDKKFKAFYEAITNARDNKKLQGLEYTYKNEDGEEDNKIFYTDRKEVIFLIQPYENY